jgi:hypothetical protein
VKAIAYFKYLRVSMISSGKMSLAFTYLVSTPSILNSSFPSVWTCLYQPFISYKIRLKLHIVLAAFLVFGNAASYRFHSAALNNAPLLGTKVEY